MMVLERKLINFLNKETMYSPVAFFAFNRPDHTNETLKSLSQNEISRNTEIFAFIDGCL